MKITSVPTQVPPPPPPPPESVTIVLTGEEAQLLRAVAGNIAGHGPVREFTDSIYYGLGEHGVQYTKEQRRMLGGSSMYVQSAPSDVKPSGKIG